MNSLLYRTGTAFLAVLLLSVSLSAQSVFRPLVGSADKSVGLSAGYTNAAPLRVELFTTGLEDLGAFDTELPAPDGRPTAIHLERQPDQLGVALWFGTTYDPVFADQPRYRDVVLSYNPASGRAYLYGLTSHSAFTLRPAPGGQHQLEVNAPLEFNDKTCEVAPAFAPNKNIQEKFLMQDGCGEQRADGTWVVDMLFGYSHEAEFIIGDLTAHAVAQAATVNTGLVNSDIDSLELRIVDIVVKDINYGVESDFLGLIPDYYGAEFALSGADMYATYQEGGGGWGQVPGQRSVQGASSPTAFRHEWGHNTGSSHCSGGINDYAAGFNNGSVRTHMCGNSINYFSNPDISVGGAPIGHVDTANNARNIRERRALLSGYSDHLVPFSDQDDGNCPAPLAAGRYFIENVASGNYLTANGVAGHKLFQSSTNATTQQVWELVPYGSGKVMLYAGNGTRVMDVFGGSTSPGHNVGLWYPSGKNLQQIVLTETPSGNYSISFFNGLCLQVPDGQLADGDEVWQDRCATAGDRGEWILRPAGGLSPVPDPSVTTTNTTCSNQQNGSVDLDFPNANAITTYSWSSGETTADLVNKAPGNYAVTITHNNINYYHSATVRTAAPLIASVSITPSYNSTGAGVATVTAVANATPPLSYAWSDGGSGASRNDLAVGIHTVTITDANGCTEERPVRILQAPDPNNDYLIQEVATGQYLSPTVPDAWWNAETPVGFANCPTPSFSWSLRGIDGRAYWLENNLSDWRLRATENGEIREWWSQNLTLQRWHLDWTGDDTFTMRLEPDSGPLYATKSSTAVSALITTTTASAATEFRIVPIPDCATAGDACTDGNNSTDDDVITLLCDCCGEPNDCFEVAGAAANGDGDADGDGACVDEDCDDNDASIFPGSFCDDGNPASFGDALNADCACEGRPAACDGADLENVAVWGTATARNSFGTSPSPSVLLDGDTTGSYLSGNGSVWHGGGGFTFVDVDLGTVQNILNFQLHTRTDCCEDRLNGVYIFLSDVPFTGVSVADAQATATYEYRVPENYDSHDPISIDPGQAVRYVRIKESMGHHLNLAEIMAFTCPQAIVLPLNLLSFTGTAGAKQHDLRWTTEREEAFAGFTLQRSTDGATFTDLTFVTARGGAQVTEYTFSDRTPPTGRSYYRLRMEDLDGTSSYSPVVVLERNTDDFVVAPNPVAAGEQLTVWWSTETAGRYELLDLAGRVVRRVALPAGRTHRISTGGLGSGVYVLRAGGAARRVVVW